MPGSERGCPWQAEKQTLCISCKYHTRTHTIDFWNHKNKDISRHSASCFYFNPCRGRDKRISVKFNANMVCVEKGR